MGSSRVVLFTALAALSLAAMLLDAKRVEPTSGQKPTSEGPNKKEKEMGFIDAHVHVWTADSARYPLAPGFAADIRKPSAFPPEELFKHTHPAGVGRINLIQISFYGFDNSYMLDTIAKYPEVFVGTAVIDPAGPDPARTMEEMARKGVRAFRIHPRLTNEPIERWLRSPGFARMFAAGARTRQAMSCLIGPDGLPELDRMCKEYADTPVIIDHLCRIGFDGEIRETDFDRLCDMARHTNVYVKIGAFYALGKKQPPYADLAPVIRKVIKAFGKERCMWESDSPYQLQDGHSYKDSIDVIQSRLSFLSAEDKEWLLRKTAERVLFGPAAPGNPAD